MSEANGIIHKKGNMVACICEGNAEKEIIVLLLENDCLIFTAEELIEGVPLSNKFRSSAKFESQYGGMTYEEKIEIIRVIDSKKESFIISESYKEKVSFIETCYTTPEIEMLYILNEEEYDNYQKSAYKKPSEYCKQELKMSKKIKNKDFCKNYFSDVNSLLKSIVKYNSIKPNKNLYSIYDLLKDEYQV